MPPVSVARAALRHEVTAPSCPRELKCSSAFCAVAGDAGTLETPRLTRTHKGAMSGEGSDAVRPSVYSPPRDKWK
jgi:hypothetical protein